jgi:hypothetical protein
VQAPAANGHARIADPADDDPLTSPSFPAINTADSRSYRTRRSASSMPGGTHRNGYPTGPDRTSGPEGYPVQPAAPQPAAQAPQVPSAPRSSGTPAANPYGSYVSPPAGRQGSSYPEAAAAGTAPADRQGYPPAAPAPSGYYPAAADGYLPPAGLDAAVKPKGRHAHNASTPRGYAEIDYGSLRYDDQAYPDNDATGLVGYAAPAGQYEQNGHGGSDHGYDQDGYQGYSGYGADRR